MQMAIKFLKMFLIIISKYSLGVTLIVINIIIYGFIINKLKN